MLHSVYDLSPVLPGAAISLALVCRRHKSTLTVKSIKDNVAVLRLDNGNQSGTVQPVLLQRCISHILTFALCQKIT